MSRLEHIQDLRVTYYIHDFKKKKEKEMKKKKKEKESQGSCIDFKSRQAFDFISLVLSSPPWMLEV